MSNIILKSEEINPESAIHSRDSRHHQIVTANGLVVAKVVNTKRNDRWHMTMMLTNKTPMVDFASVDAALDCAQKWVDEVSNDPHHCLDIGLRCLDKIYGEIPPKTSEKTKYVPSALDSVTSYRMDDEITIRKLTGGETVTGRIKRLYINEEEETVDGVQFENGDIYSFHNWDFIGKVSG